MTSHRTSLGQPHKKKFKSYIHQRLYVIKTLRHVIKTDFIKILKKSKKLTWSTKRGPGRGFEALGGILSPGWENGDQNSCASPGNGKPLFSGPLHYKNDNWPVVIVIVFRDRN